MSDSLVADVVFPLVIVPETKRPLHAQIRFACEEGYHPSISVRSPIDRSEIDVISLVFGTACSFSSRDHNGLRTLRLDFFPQKEVTHVRPTSLLANHLKLHICFVDRDHAEVFFRAIKTALLQKAMLKHHYTAELFAPDGEQSGTVMYSIKVSKCTSASPSAESSLSSSSISRRFTSFKELHASLVSLGIPVRKLPGKDWRAVVKSKKHDPERLAAKATKLSRFIDSICTHERTAKLPVLLEFLSLNADAVQDASAAMGKLAVQGSQVASPKVCLSSSSSAGSSAIKATVASASPSAASSPGSFEVLDVRVTSFTVLKDGSDSHASEYVSYEISVTFRGANSDSGDSQTKTLHKRFSDFRTLRKDLAEQCEAVPALPGKAWLAVTHKAKFDANRLHVKQGNLGQFLADCLKSPKIVRNSKFLEFCGLVQGGSSSKSKPRIDTDMSEAKKLRRAGKWVECYQLYLKCAEEGHAEAQAWVGHCLINAKGVPRDEAKAVVYFKSSAESGLSMAQVKLGACYEQGIGVPKNPAEAVKWCVSQFFRCIFV
jgi:hypothetical protein